MSQIRFFLFGSPRIEREESNIEIGLRKGLALIIYLAKTRRACSRDALAAMFWPDDDQSTARANLRRVMHRLRKLLGETALDPGSETVSLNSSASIWIDVE